MIKVEIGGVKNLSMNENMDDGLARWKISLLERKLGRSKFVKQYPTPIEHLLSYDVWDD